MEGRIWCTGLCTQNAEKKHFGACALAKLLFLFFCVTMGVDIYRKIRQNSIKAIENGRRRRILC